MICTYFTSCIVGTKQSYWKAAPFAQQLACLLWQWDVGVGTTLDLLCLVLARVKNYWQMRKFRALYVCDCGPPPCSQPREQAQSTHFCSCKCIGSVYSYIEEDQAPHIKEFLMPRLSTTSASRVWIFNSYLNLSHLHIPLLSEKINSSEERANWCGPGRWACKEMS